MFEGASGRWPRRRSSPPRRRPAGRPTPSPSLPQQPDRQIKNQDQSSFTKLKPPEQARPPPLQNGECPPNRPAHK